MASPALARLGHVALRTPDLAGSLEFFDDLLGLEVTARDERCAYLRAWGDHEHHTLALIEDGDGRFDHAGWRARRPEDVAAFGGALRAEGIEVEEVAPGAEAGQGAALRFRTPTGLPYEIYYDVEKRPPAGLIKTNTARPWHHGISPRRLDHVNFVSPDVEAEEAWSRSVLGFGTRERVRGEDGAVRGAWLGVSALAHDLALGAGPTAGGLGLHHIAFFVDNASDVLRAAEMLIEAGIEPDHGPGRHAVSQAVCLYARDPVSNHRVEIYSGSYLVLDPDWETIEWSASEYRQWWGAQPVRVAGAPLEGVTPC